MNPDALRVQMARSIAIMKKNILIYYLKGPVVIFGLIMPLFLFLAFYLGNRGYAQNDLIARLIAVTVFFTAAAVSPVIIPLESQMRTLERLATSPITAGTMIFGDILASFVFCVGIACIPLFIAFCSGTGLATLAILSLVVLLGALCFSAMGLLYSAPRFNAPSDVMMIASLVKFSLVFISGVFIPLAGLPAWGRLLAMVSPLTYFMDLTEYLLQGSHYFPVIMDLIALVAMTTLFIAVALVVHTRTLPLKI